MKLKKVGFASGIGFILASAGSAVGLGNLWAFPYKVGKNGGAAFVFVYIACVLLIGLVTMVAEIFIGKRAQANPVTAYKKVHKNIGWFGLVGVVIPFFITCYYIVLGGYTVKFTMNSFAADVNILPSFSVNTGEVILYTAIFALLAAAIIMGGVKDGIEKVSKVLMPALFIILVGVVVYSLCLGDGVAEGLAFYLKPDFSALTFDAVLAAMGQAFFSLSLGMGILITYGSYAGKEINILKSAGMICLFDTLVALLAGLAIFPAVAHFDPALLESSRGIGLMFSILPQVFGSMGWFGQIVSFFFFGMVAIAALTSVISLIEVVTQFFIQKFKLDRKKASLIAAAACFVISIPIGISLGKVGICEEEGLNLFGMDWLTFFDEVTNTVLMPVCALFACLTAGWLIGAKNTANEIEESGTRLGWFKNFFRFMLQFITPALILVVEVGGLINKFKDGQASVVIFAYALLVLTAILYFLFFRNTDTGTNEDEKIGEPEED